MAGDISPRPQSITYITTQLGASFANAPINTNITSMTGLTGSIGGSITGIVNNSSQLLRFSGGTQSSYLNLETTNLSGMTGNYVTLHTVVAGGAAKSDMVLLTQANGEVFIRDTSQEGILTFINVNNIKYQLKPGSLVSGTPINTLPNSSGALINTTNVRSFDTYNYSFAGGL